MRSEQCALRGTRSTTRNARCAVGSTLRCVDALRNAYRSMHKRCTNDAQTMHKRCTNDAQTMHKRRNALSGRVSAPCAMRSAYGGAELMRSEVSLAPPVIHLVPHRSAMHARVGPAPRPHARAHMLIHIHLADEHMNTSTLDHMNNA
jgi:hypothetical protein